MSNLAPIAGRLRTRCCACSAEFYIRPSLAMQMGLNTGHCTCKNCNAFLHVEALEGDVAWTELHRDYLAKLEGNRGPSLVGSITESEAPK